MKLLFTYIFLSLTCTLNWISVFAYKPISSYLSSASSFFAVSSNRDRMSSNRLPSKKYGDLLGTLWHTTSSFVSKIKYSNGHNFTVRQLSLTALTALSWKIDNGNSGTLSPDISDIDGDKTCTTSKNSGAVESYLNEKSSESFLSVLYHFMTNNLQGKKSAIGPSVNENDTALIESIVTTRISSSTSSELNVELAKLKDNYMKTVNPITEKRASNFGIVNAHLIGFMEYDPKSGAASSHRLYSQRKSRSSSSNSWFHM